jgi:hypothetical protein
MGYRKNGASLASLTAEQQAALDKLTAAQIMALNPYNIYGQRQATQMSSNNSDPLAIGSALYKAASDYAYNNDVAKYMAQSQVDPTTVGQAGATLAQVPKAISPTDVNGGSLYNDTQRATLNNILDNYPNTGSLLNTAANVIMNGYDANGMTDRQQSTLGNILRENDDSLFPQNTLNTNTQNYNFPSVTQGDTNTNTNTSLAPYQQTAMDSVFGNSNRNYFPMNSSDSNVTPTVSNPTQPSSDTTQQESTAQATTGEGNQAVANNQTSSTNKTEETQDNSYLSDYWDKDKVDKRLYDAGVTNPFTRDYLYNRSVLPMQIAAHREILTNAMKAYNDPKASEEDKQKAMATIAVETDNPFLIQDREMKKAQFDARMNGTYGGYGGYGGGYGGYGGGYGGYGGYGSYGGYRGYNGYSNGYTPRTYGTGSGSTYTDQDGKLYVDYKTGNISYTPNFDDSSFGKNTSLAMYQYGKLEDDARNLYTQIQEKKAKGEDTKDLEKEYEKSNRIVTNAQKQVATMISDRGLSSLALQQAGNNPELAAWLLYDMIQSLPDLKTGLDDKALAGIITSAIASEISISNKGEQALAQKLIERVQDQEDKDGIEEIKEKNLNHFYKNLFTDPSQQKWDLYNSVGLNDDPNYYKEHYDQTSPKYREDEVGLNDNPDFNEQREQKMLANMYATEEGMGENYSGVYGDTNRGYNDMVQVPDEESAGRGSGNMLQDYIDAAENFKDYVDGLPKKASAAWDSIFGNVPDSNNDVNDMMWG